MAWWSSPSVRGPPSSDAVSFGTRPEFDLLSDEIIILCVSDGPAPAFLNKCTKAGVPIYCVLITTLISCINFLAASNKAVEVFYWFVDLTTTALIANIRLHAHHIYGLLACPSSPGFD